MRSNPTNNPTRRTRSAPSSSVVKNKARWKLDPEVLDDACLLVIDGQKKYLHNTNVEVALPQISRLIDWMRRHGKDVYWTQFRQIDGYNSFPGEAHHDFHGGGEDQTQLILEGDEDIIPSIHPDAHGLKRSRIFATSRYSSFTNAELATKLTSHRTIIVVGGWSEFCVLATCFAAIDRNVKAVVASDALFTERVARNGWAQELIATGCGRVETTREILRALARSIRNAS